MEDKKNNDKKYRIVYGITEKPGYKTAFWSKCGIAWVNQDQSINLYLDAIPLSGKLQIRDRDEERDRRWNNRGAQEPLGEAAASFDFGGNAIQ